MHVALRGSRSSAAKGRERDPSARRHLTPHLRRLTVERQKALAARLVLAVALAAIVLGCDQRDKAGLATFAGHWQGHGPAPIIPTDGRASESIYTRCCYFALP